MSTPKKADRDNTGFLCFPSYKKNKIFLFGDTHLGHKNVIAYENRPFNSTAEMNLGIWKNFIRTVDRESVVIHLGDFGLLTKDLYYTSLRAYCKEVEMFVLCHGNHDRSVSSIIENMQGVDNFFLFKHLVFGCDGRYKFATHNPNNFDKDSVKTLYPEVEIDEWVCGHVHSKTECAEEWGFNAYCVETTNYSPVLVDWGKKGEV